MAENKSNNIETPDVVTDGRVGVTLKNSTTGKNETVVLDPSATTAGPPDSFLHSLEKFLKDTDRDGGILYHFISPTAKTVLSQYWNLKDFDDGERGPISLGDGNVRNWAGNQAYKPVFYDEPANLDEVKATLEKAYNMGVTVTPVGGAYGSSPLVSTTGGILYTGKLISTAADMEVNTGIALDHPVMTVKALSGTPIIDIIQVLSNRDLILPTTPIFAKMAAGGGAAVGIHGTGRNFQTLCDYIREMEVVNVNEEGVAVLTKYTKEKNAEVMKALTVNLGALGFVYTITFEVIAAFNLEAVDEHIPYPDSKEKLQALMENIVLKNDYVEFFWWPLTNFLWIKRWNKTEQPVTPDYDRKLQDVNQYLQSYATDPVLKILSLFPHWTPKMMAFLGEMSLPHKITIVAKANYIYNYLVAVPPKHWDMNQCLNIKKTPMGYDFSKIADSYWEIKQMTQEEAAQGKFPLNTTLHTRFISHSDSFLSPINGNDYSAMTEVVTFNITRDWLNFYKRVESMWLSKGGRPHWGKLICKLPDRSVWGQDHDGVAKFNAIRKQMDPHRLFETDFVYDVLERIFPKMMNITIKSVSINDHTARTLGLGHWVESILGIKRDKYQVVIETAEDRRETEASKDTSRSTTFRNVTFSHFAQFQLLVNNKLAGTAVWQSNEHPELKVGQKATYNLQLRPDWFTPVELGNIEVEITPLHIYNHQAPQESIAIIGNTNDTQLWASLSAKCGLEVFVGAQEGAADMKIPGVQVVPVATACDSAHIIVFACPHDQFKKYMKDTKEHLVDKVIIDATSYHHPAEDASTPSSSELSLHDHLHLEEDSYDSFLPKYASIAKMVEFEEKDGGGNMPVVLVAADDLGTKVSIMKWITSMGLQVRDAGPIHAAPTLAALARLKNKALNILHIGHNHDGELLTPQHDQDHAKRGETLEQTRARYVYDTDYFPECAIPEKYPLSADWKVNPTYLFKVIKSLAKGQGYYNLWERLTLPHDNTLSGFQPLNVFSNAYFASDATTWCPDASLGASRLAGPDPRSLVRVTKMEDIPTENFPVTPALFADAAEGANLEKEVADGNVFLVNYEILEMFKESNAQNRYVCAPIALFWWNEAQLRPIFIQVNPKYDAQTNPIVNRKQGLVWEAAKVYFQCATTLMHGMCAHEYDQHVVAGAFSMATPRNLAPIHPVYVLLYPHLQFTVAHTATKNASMRINLQSPFFATDADMSRELVTAHSKNQMFYKLAFDTSLKLRGVEQHPPVNSYPYREDGLLLWNAVYTFVTEYIALYYPTNNEVVDDIEIQNWYAELNAADGGRLHSVLENSPEKITKIEQLVRILATFIFTAGPHHAITHFSQTEYMTDALHILPGHTQEKWPIHAPQTPQDFQHVLPARSSALTQAATFAAGDMRYNEFGHYSDYQLGKVAAAAPAIKKLQATLVEIEAQIIEKDKTRALPYPYFRPSLIPNATNI